MAYGSPERLEDVPAYYADIRGGRPIRPELLDDLVERYRALGIDEGSPLERDHRGDPRRARAGARAAGLHGDAPLAAAHRRGGRARARRRRDDGRRPRARPALLLALDRQVPRAARGCARGPRRAALRRELGRGARLRRAPIPPCYHVNTGSRRTGTSSSPRTASPRGSSPRATRTRTQLLRTAELVAAAAGIDDWSFSFQSESATGEPWLGPDILDHLAALHERGVRDVLVCPVGFVADHLEIRWDLDTEAARARGGARDDARADRDAERRPRVRADARGDRPAGACGTVGRMRRRRRSRSRACRGASASTRAHSER